MTDKQLKHPERGRAIESDDDGYCRTTPWDWYESVLSYPALSAQAERWYRRISGKRKDSVPTC